MATRLRWYQREALDALNAFFHNNDGNPLVVAATGAGKSVLISQFIKEQCEAIKDLRVIALAHQAELLSQNYQAIVRNWPSAPCGLWSASLNKKSRGDRILVAGIQSVWNKVEEVGEFDLILVDEAHLIPRDQGTQYASFILAQIAARPWCRVVGFTATPQRMDSGSLVEGEDRLFDVVVYDIDVATLIKDGFLTPLGSKPTTFKIEMKAKRSNGDWSNNAVAKEVDKEEIIQAAVAETVEFARKYGSKCALIFCAGVEHATHVAEEFRRYQFGCEVVHGGTPKAERRNLLQRLKDGKLWGLTNDSVLTTGIDIASIDLIVMLRPTGSVVLYQQILGRGLRVVWPAGFVPDDHTAEERRAAIASGPKPICRVLDYAGNIARHGPVDDIYVRKKGEKMPGENGVPEAPHKVCPQCDTRNSIQTFTCVECQHEFEREEKAKHDAEATTAAIMKGEVPLESAVKWVSVERIDIEVWHKTGQKPTLRVNYKLEHGSVAEWLGWWPDGNAKKDLQRFWNLAMPGRMVPGTAEIAIRELQDMIPISSIAIEKKGKYFDVRDHMESELIGQSRAHVPTFFKCDECNTVSPKGDDCPSCARKAKAAPRTWEHEEDIPF